MEICRMDKQPHFNLGMNSQHMLDANYNFNEIPNSECEATSSYNYVKEPTQNELIGYQEFQKLDNSENNWKNVNVDCKQETDSANVLHNSQISENSNYGQDDEFNEAYHYAYNQISPLYTNDANNSSLSAATNRALNKNDNSAQQRHMGYHISSTKNQLPSWYNPPPTSFPQHHSAFQQQYPAYHHEGFMGAHQLDPDMRNMIQMTSRYFSDF